ncbi:MAG: TPM domain-containing protein [Bacteroidales bacterium]
MIKSGKYLAIWILGLAPVLLFSQEDLPVPGNPQSWVNDYADIFTEQEASRLEQQLSALEYNTSTQIFVVTIDENNGYPVSMLAPMIGEQWEVGQAEKDNGAVVLVDMEDQDVFISTGYGLEEYIPDAIAKRIVEKEILPQFRQGNYFEGVEAGVKVMMSLLDGQFTPEEYRKQTSAQGGSAIGSIIFLMVIFFLIFGSRRRRAVGVGGRRSSLPFWLALGLLSGSRSSGSWGNFSSGSGSFGGGGFGGFSGGGGGSFGGGGAGGSW